MTDSVIEARGLELRREGYPVFAGLDWTVCKGERWAILGPNGAGKSTLSQALQGRLHPWEGTLSVLGIRFGKDVITSLWKDVGFAGEALERLFPPVLSLENLVASGLLGSIGFLFETPTKADYARSRKALSIWGLGERLKQNYHTASLGERRKALIARALVGAPKLLVLDEPFAGLDPAAREDMVAELDRLTTRRPELPIVLVTHHTEEIPAAWTHVLLLPHGAPPSLGTAAQQLTSAKLSELYHRPFAVRKVAGRRFLLPEDG